MSIKFAVSQLKATIEMKDHEIRKLQDQITAKEAQQGQIEIDVDDYIYKYDSLLDESGPVTVAGLGFYPSRILGELDPIAYRCGLNDYVDSTYSAEDTDEYKALSEEIDFLADQIDVLQEEINDLENQIEELEE
jgi:predicted  nucleic acid-binding Zn-ribbon protein